MFSIKQKFTAILFFAVIFINSAIADWKENAKVTNISGGQDHTLIITQDKFSWGCGRNNNRQLGIGDIADSQTTPVHVHGYNNNGFLGDTNDVSAGNTHSLILDANSSVWAAGYNDKGQLGDSYTYRRETPVLVHGVNNNGILKHIVGISASKFGDSSTGRHSLAVDSNNLVYAWGFNHKGQLGQGSSDYNPHSTPLKVKAGEQNPGNPTLDFQNAVAVSAGEDQSMVLDENGFVYTFGQNNDDYYGTVKGRLGAGSTQDYNDLPLKVHGPNNVGYLQNIVAISAGWNHCVALEDIYPLDPNKQGRVYTWGYNGITGNSYSRSGGRLGDGTTTDRPTPVFVKAGEQDPNNPNEPLDMIVAIAAGEGHTIFLTAAGQVLCVGDNYYGQLGNGKRGLGEKSLKPVKVKGWNGSGYLSNIVAIAAGGWHSLAIAEDGTIYAWGFGYYGQTGIGLKNPYYIYNVSTPQIVHPVYNLTSQRFYFAIQTAVNDANSNNIIEASKGVYYENVDLGSKPLTLRSADPNNLNTVEETIFNVPQSDSGFDYAVKLTNNTGSEVSGFTIANPDSEDSRGIKCTKSTLDVSRIVIKDMTHHSLYCEQGSSLQVSDCNFLGGGFVLDGLNCPDSNCFVDVDNCTFRNFKRGGIAAIYCCSDLNVTNCEITNNNTGISCGFKSNTAVNIANCLISGHMEKGIKFTCSEQCYYVSPSVSIHNNVISGNNWGIAFGESTYIGDQSPVVWFYGNVDASITNNIISGNTDGLHISPYKPSNAMTYYLRNNTIVDNSDGLHLLLRGDLGSPPYPAADIVNCILWDNLQHMINKEANEFAVSVTFSDIPSGYGNSGNIYSDPCFVPGDFYHHIGHNSRCIDAGDGNYPDETDIDGEPRMLDGDANGTVIVDMGSDEFSDTYNCGRADFNLDRIVNFFDYAVLANAWLTQSGGAGYNEICDLVEDNSIDNKDLKVFCMDCWLWQMQVGNILSESMMAQGQGGEESIFAQSMEIQPEQMLAEQAEPVNVEELTNWLDEIWNTGELSDVMTESEYLELKGAIEASGE